MIYLEWVFFTYALFGTVYGTVMHWRKATEIDSNYGIMIWVATAVLHYLRS